MGSPPMRHRVVWRTRVTNHIHTAAFLMYEHGRSEAPLFEAIAEINERLELRPEEVGESREDRERVLIQSPLTVWYEVFEQDGVVLIYDAILYPRQRM